MITYIQPSELEQLAHRVRYAKWPHGSWINGDMKYADFESMGLPGRSAEFPMRSGEWVVVGRYEISFCYPRFDIPGYIYVRKYTGKQQEGCAYRELEGLSK